MFQVITESWKELFTASLRDDLSFSSLKRVHNTVGGGRLSHYQLDTAAVDDRSMLGRRVKLFALRVMLNLPVDLSRLEALGLENSSSVMQLDS